MLGATIGAILSLIAYIAYEHALLLRKPSEFFGKWQSSWQPTITPSWDWVNEELVIKRRFGKIFLQNYNNSGGYHWRGRARIVENKFLIGEWKSTKHGAQMEGTFTLAIGYEGGYMCGFFFAPDTPTQKIVSAFVLGRTLKDIEDGKQKLMKAKIVFPRPSTST